MLWLPSTNSLSKPIAVFVSLQIGEIAHGDSWNSAVPCFYFRSFLKAIILCFQKVWRYYEHFTNKKKVAPCMFSLNSFLLWSFWKQKLKTKAIQIGPKYCPLFKNSRFMRCICSVLQEKTNDDVPMPTYFRFLALLAFKIFSAEQVNAAILFIFFLFSFVFFLLS